MHRETDSPRPGEGPTDDAAPQPRAAQEARTAAQRIANLLTYSLTDPLFQGESLRRRAYPLAADALRPRRQGAGQTSDQTTAQTGAAPEQRGGTPPAPVARHTEAPVNGNFLG